MGRRRSLRCLLIPGLFILGLLALANSGKRFAVDIRVVGDPDDQVLLDAAATLDAGATISRKAPGREPPRPAARPDQEPWPPQADEDGDAPGAPPAPAPPRRESPAPAQAPAPAASKAGGLRKGCKYKLPNQVSSRPGPPCIPPAKIWPYKTNTAWRTTLGERIVESVTPEVTEEQCQGWHMFGDQTWCNKAMKRKGVLALSFGIEERDLYSEYMSNYYHVPTKLYDCFIEPEKSPPIAGTAPNGTKKCGNSGGHCYETPYQPFRICLGPKSGTIQGRQYQTLANALRGRPPLSMHVKIDVEGSEWTVLENLLASDADQAKIRTLDMEIHYGFRAASESEYNDLPEEDQLMRQIKIIEGLRDKFYCTGSTLEVYRQGWFPDKDCRTQECHEPVVHTAGGFSPQMFAVSYVNKAIVDGPDGEAPLAFEGFGPPAAPAPAPAKKNKRPSSVSSAMEELVPATDRMRTCTYELPHAQSSRPGPPCVPPAPYWPYKTNTKWRTVLGERILRAVTPLPEANEEACGGWELFGDQTWCKKAFGRKHVMAFSFGIEERDMYSEYLSNNFHIPSKLFDCFQRPEHSPPLSGTAPNATGKCRGGGHCYEAPYWPYQVCLGPRKEKFDGRWYNTLANHLRGYGPLSTHVKIDVEGSEWTVLEQLVASDEDQAKIRTLDMEIHFGFHAQSEGEYDSWSQQDRITREIQILEGLRRKFYVTGTTLEVYRQGWKPEQDCKKSQCGEPVVHLAGGFSPQMFAISFVNKAILQVDGGAADEEGLDTPPVPAPAPAPAKKSKRPSSASSAMEELVPATDRMRTCTYELPHAQSSRPGPPCVPPAPYWPYKTNTKWRAVLGERILRAVTPLPEANEEACGGWELFGDQTWCKKAFGRKQVMAFSFGIEERDMYSEYLSNNFHIPSKLFDCFQRPEHSPPLSGKAPNATGKCRGGGHCYEAPYWPYQVCLGPRKEKFDGRWYNTLANHLRGYGPLSTHVKIDVEGSEWTVLEQLVASDEDQAKIRTLDMEIHFGFHAQSEGEYDSWSQQDRITREIEILEGLRRKFYVTGTTLEVYRQGWKPEQDCKTAQCGEPVVHLAGGFSPQMFAISFVNKAILQADGAEAQEEGPSFPQQAPPLPRQRAMDQDEEEEEREEAGGADSPEGKANAAPPLLPPPPDAGPYAAKYGFYLHVFNFPAAVIHQVRSIKKHFPGSPMYLMSDGGMRFDELCRVEGCMFQLCPPANDRWHPWPFLHRMYEGAKALNTEYVIMLEPDNTIHGPIKREPRAAAGGLPVKDRKFGYREFAEKQAQKKKPGFQWTDRAMSAGLAGGAYFRRDVILDAFSDESVAAFDWNYIAEKATKEVFSSDFAMQYLLAARGYEMEPWDDSSQMERSKDKPHSGAQDAAFRHYCGCYPGGKPTYNLAVKPRDRGLFQDPLPKHNAENSNCQICYYPDKYKRDWGSMECTNPHKFQYSKLIMSRYFPDGKYPQMR